jgi:hypothetical protein
MLRRAQHERKIINDIKSPPSACPERVEGLRERALSAVIPTTSTKTGTRNPGILVQGAYGIRPFWMPVFTGMTVKHQWLANEFLGHHARTAPRRGKECAMKQQIPPRSLDIRSRISAVGGYVEKSDYPGSHRLNLNNYAQTRA